MAATGPPPGRLLLPGSGLARRLCSGRKRRGAGAPCCALRVGTHSPRLPAAPRCCLCDDAVGDSLLRAALHQRRALRTLRLVFEPPHLGPPPPSSELRASGRASLTPWPSPTEAGLSQGTHFKSHAQGSAHPAVVSSACPSCPRQQLAVGEGPQRPAGDQPALMTFPLPRLGQAAGLPLSSWGSHCCWSGCTRAARGAWPCHTCAGGHRTEVPPKPRVCGPDQPCLAAEAIPPLPASASLVAPAPEPPTSQPPRGCPGPPVSCCQTQGWEVTLASPVPRGRCLKVLTH